MQLQHICESLFQEMLGEIYQSRQIDLSDSSRIAYCFKISIEYWSKVKKRIRSLAFTNPEEEIWFFKTMKPRFTSLIEYYTMSYNAELSLYALKEAEIPAFWEQENEKPEHFYRTHQDFCAYYKTSRTDKDHLYFLRSNKNGSACIYNKLYDTDANMVTSHSHLAALLLAYDMYATYILQQAVKKV